MHKALGMPYSRLLDGLGRIPLSCLTVTKDCKTEMFETLHFVTLLKVSFVLLNVPTISTYTISRVSIPFASFGFQSLVKSLSKVQDECMYLFVYVFLSLSTPSFERE